MRSLLAVPLRMDFVRIRKRAVDETLQQGLGILAQKLLKFWTRPRVALCHTEGLDMILDFVPHRGGDFGSSPDPETPFS